MPPLLALASLNPARANGSVLSTSGKSLAYDSGNHLMSMTTTGTSAAIGRAVRPRSRTIGATMQSALSASFTPPIPAWGEPSENSRPGLPRQNRTWNPGPTAVNSTTVLGMRAASVLEGVRKPHSARYYNPLTGRFVSMDPENGILTDPKTLHKFLYANGDPVNLKDPTGRAGTGEATAGGGDLGEYAGLALLAFAAVRTAQTVEQQNPGSIAASMHELGEELDCDFHFEACLISGLAGYNGSVYGSGRCLECKEACIKNDGDWPSSAARTRGSVRCDYWNFK